MKNHKQFTRIQREQLATLKLLDERLPKGVEYNVNVLCYQFKGHDKGDMRPVFVVAIYDKETGEINFHRNELIYKDSELDDIIHDLNEYLDEKYPIQK